MWISSISFAISSTLIERMATFSVRSRIDSSSAIFLILAPDPPHYPDWRTVAAAVPAPVAVLVRVIRQAVIGVVMYPLVLDVTDDPMLEMVGIGPVLGFWVLQSPVTAL